MKELAAFAASIAVPARAAMLLKLLDGRGVHGPGEIGDGRQTSRPRRRAITWRTFWSGHFLRASTGKVVHRYLLFSRTKRGGARA